MSAFDELDQVESKSAFDELDAAEQPAPTTQPQPKMGVGEAAGRGFVSGGTFGWNDEIAGGMVSGYDALAKAFGFQGVPEVPRVDRAGNPIENSLYARTRDDVRAQDEKAQADQSLAYMGGQIAGGIATSGAGGLGVKAAAKAGSKVAGKVLAGRGATAVGTIAAEGAVQGLGEANEASGEAALKGAGSSLVGAGVMKGTGKLLKKTGKLAPRLARTATRKRLNAAGIDPRLKSADMGATSPEAQALRMRKLGIGKAKWGFIPASTDEINEQATSAAERMRKGRQGLEADFKREGIMAEPGRAGQRLRNRAKDLAGPESRERRLVRLKPAENVPNEPSTVPDMAATAPNKAIKSKAVSGTADTVPDQKPYWHHATPESNLDKIRAEGLSPRHGGKNYDLKKNRGRVYFSPENQADHWAQNLEGFSGEKAAKLRMRRSVSPVPGANPDIKIRDKTVPPQDLELQNSQGSWQPLVDKQALDRASNPKNLKLTPLPPLPPQNVYKEVRGKRIPNPETAPMQEALKERARYFEGMDRQVPFDQLNAERAAYGGKAKFHLDSPQAAVRQDVHKALNDELTLAAGARGKQWRGMGQDEHAAILARDKSAEKLDQQSKAGFGLRDLAAGAAGTALGGPFGGPLGVALNRGMNGRGMSTQAAAYEALTSGARGSSVVGRALDSKRAARVGGSVGRAVNNPENQETPEDAARARYIEEFTR